MLQVRNACVRGRVLRGPAGLAPGWLSLTTRLVDLVLLALVGAVCVFVHLHGPPLCSPGPGPLDTDMFSAARSSTADPGLRRAISDMSTQGQVLTCEQSCAKLMKLLLEDTYQSGAHVDFHDI